MCGSTNLWGGKMNLNILEALESRRLLSAGDADLSFGNIGQITGSVTVAPNGLSRPQLSDIAQQKDGRLIAAGVDGDTNSILVSRFSAQREMDLAFGHLGVG